MNTNNSEVGNEQLEEGGIFHLPTLSEKSAEAESTSAAMSKEKRRNFTIILSVVAVVAIVLGVSLSSKGKAHYPNTLSSKSSTSTIVTSSLTTTSGQNSWSLSDRDTEWLTAHNERRKEYHEANGKTYVPMTWSSQLANQAKERATNLSCDDTLSMTGNLGVVGENIASNSGPGTWGAPRSPDNVLSRWVDKAMNLGWPDNQHMTQVLWRGTTRVGCGESMKRYDGGTCRIQVCFYKQPGNCYVDEDNPGTGDNWKAKMLRNVPCA